MTLKSFLVYYYPTLGFNPSSETILLSELTTALERHLVSGETDGSTHLAAILTVLNEWRQARSTIAGLVKEKDRLMRELQQLNENTVAEQSTTYIALEGKYRREMEALQQEQAEQYKLMRAHYTKKLETQRQNLAEQLQLNQSLHKEIQQKSQEHDELRQQLENSKNQLLLTQSVIHQTQEDLASASQTNEKVEYERFMDCKTQLDELIARIRELPIPDDPSQVIIFCSGSRFKCVFCME
ncbi:unnamed protein product [Echinostoma caproni]|uniref:KfrA_N domain-containing protein n=1 Tax=Echinostoma caproni TaxID=27848 RepID=A0A183B1C9_9TREM|nr:unnamed protein product [Echinostoma caproni]